MTATGVLRENIWFHYLSLKSSLTLPHKGKMLWCSYFRFLIKSVYFSRCGNFIKNLSFVSTPWKIIIPLGNSVGGPYVGYTNPSWWVMIFFFVPKCHFLTIWWKNLTAIGGLRKYIWFSIPVPKIKFDPPPTREKCFGDQILGSSLKSINLDRCGNLIEKFNFVSPPWKIIIPKAITTHTPSPKIT